MGRSRTWTRDERLGHLRKERLASLGRLAAATGKLSEAHDRANHGPHDMLTISEEEAISLVRHRLAQFDKVNEGIRETTARN